MALGAAPARAGDPSQRWRTLESEHFVVHYYLPLTDIAERVAVLAERAHEELVPAFRHAPREKTHIVVTDDGDGANGFARVIPRNQIRIFAPSPTGLSALADYDDWYYLLVAHEYAHILHLDSIGGLPALYNRIFGKTWAPNQIQPRWLIEGIATYQESEVTAGGRIRNSIFHMYLRMAHLAGDPLDLDHLSTGPRKWPHGNAAYLYGSHFLKYIFDTYGPDKLADLSWAYGNEPVPWGLNRAIERAIGERYPELYAEWRDYLRGLYELQRQTVERRGLREGRRLTFTGETSFSPRYTAGGDALIWRESDGVREARFLRMPVGWNASRARTYAVVHRTGEFALLADDGMIVEKTTRYRYHYDYQDLYRFEADTGSLTRLTRGLRARDPAVSPDQSQLAFVVSGRGRRDLAVMPLKPHAEHQILWSGPGRFDQVYNPVWSPDGRTIAFSAWTEGGYRDIYLLDVATGEAQPLWRSRSMDTNPTFGPDGRTLYFSSDRTGIYNVYAYDLDSRELHQVTNVLGGAFTPDVSPDGRRLAYMGYTSRGHDLYEIELDRRRWLAAEPYLDDRPDPVRIDDDAYPLSPSRRYRPLETLAPRSYSLETAVSSTSRSIGVRTGGSDVIGRHAYSLGATLDDQGDLAAAVSYSYNRLWPWLRFSASRNASRRGGVIIDGSNTSYTEEALSLSARGGLTLWRTADSTATLSAGYDFSWLRNTDDAFEDYDPNELVPRFPETDVFLSGASIALSYGDQRGTIYTVGPQRGKAASVSLGFDHPAIGSDFQALTLRYSWHGYAPLPWDASLSLRAIGGFRSTDRERAGLFSLGGVAGQDVVRSIAQEQQRSATGYLRGYPAGVARGSQFHLANFEYRHLLLEIERGMSTLPIYVRRVHAAALLDAGDAFNGRPELDRLKLSAGGALRLDMVFGYFMPGTLDLGYARGLSERGLGEYWLLFTGTL
jgi:hypothetical protein